MDKINLMTREEVAERLRISLRSVDRMTARGMLTAARIGGHRIMYRETDIENYIAKQFRQAAG